MKNPTIISKLLACYRVIARREYDVTAVAGPGDGVKRVKKCVGE